MKKLFTLIAFIGLAFGANAQRHCDLQLAISGTPSTYAPGQPLPISFTITNNGPDVYKAADTTLFQFYIGGAASPVFLLYNLNLAVGASKTYNDTLNFKYANYASDSTKQFCMAIATEANISADSVTDTAFTNNVACANLVLLDVKQITLGENNMNVSVFPNPAQAEINIGIDLKQPANVSVKLFDMIGREVYTKNADKLNAGINTVNINTSNFANGVYMYQVTVGEETKTGRFTVAK